MSHKQTLLSADAICAVIKTCAESGVGEIAYGPLHVVFLKKLELDKASLAPLPEAEISEAQTLEDHASRMFDEERELRRRQLSDLHITDPEAYEDLVARGELQDRTPQEPSELGAV
jgi:hypothetical protein